MQAGRSLDRYQEDLCILKEYPEPERKGGSGGSFCRSLRSDWVGGREWGTGFGREPSGMMTGELYIKQGLWEEVTLLAGAWLSFPTVRTVRLG